jgi:ariadne-1
MTTLDEVPVAAADALPCGHFFARATWSEYLAVRLAGTPEDVISTRCLAHEGDRAGCRQLATPRMFTAALPPPLHAKYREGIARAYVMGSPQVKFCPAPGCTFAVECRGGANRDVACAEGHAFCFACSTTGGPGEAHGPATCATVKAWLQREVDSGENSKWLKANTKTCPRCYQNIEKNQGCTVSLATRWRMET